ncbi:YbhB/YbcL family Raf kinase inhibitor-like protein [Streptomyces sp. NPDC047017]|uniref:YbhB/YbcL family Raf kinase inhibitor-like protein n=1 Tax=Streptomyces sp. NPDC047017 TaxID=3155024 RepID=UPI0033DA609C
MAVLGKLLKNKRAGDENLAWNLPHLAGPDMLKLSTPDFAHVAAIPTLHAGKRLGGQDLSPALGWEPTPAGTAQLLLVVEDPDAPTAMPYNHGIALLEPSVTGLPQGGLDAGTTTAVVRVLSSGSRRGYLGPAPIRSRATDRIVTPSSCSRWASR